MAELKTIRDWYGGRTQHILERYGADAPRVHYHTGLVDSIPKTTDVDELKKALRKAQVRLLDIAAREWHAADQFKGAILDSGCGLGGGSIYWAEHFGVNVTGISLVQEHLDLVRKYAHEVGGDHCIETLCCDAHEVHLQPNQLQRYSAVVAIDSSCYMRLVPWFNCLRQVLKPGGRVFIADGFVGPHANRTLIDQVDEYFACKMVRVGEYLAGTRNRSVKAIDLSDEAARFFGTTYPLIFIQATNNNKLREKESSLTMHKLLRYLFDTRQLQYLMLEVDPWG